MLLLSPSSPPVDDDDFPKFADHGDLLDIIDFDDLYVDVAGDVLPHLEIHTHHMHASSTITTTSAEKTDSQGKGISSKGEEVVTKRDDAAAADTLAYDPKTKYSSSASSNNQVKRKLKVDWTPELHRRFVDAVEQLGVDKAVPSRILELMGVHCRLTRHNVASHLQKYRSHRKHLLAREAQTADWTRKRHIYGVDNTGRNLNGGNKTGWLAPAPTLGFPPVAVAPQPVHFRPLHVWGHPTVDQSVRPHVWPKHLTISSNAMGPNPMFWVSDSPYWHPIHNPYMPTAATRFRAGPVAGGVQPHHTAYHGFGGPRPLVLDLHPSKESVDAAIGDVLTRPWLPLPLGLKPPAVEGVMTELQRHGVSDVPPTNKIRRHFL